MLEQQGNALTFLAFYTEGKVAKTGLTVTVDIYEGTNEIVTAGNATEIGDGLYYYTLAAGSVDANALYVAVFKTATTTVDQQHIPALWIVGRAWVANVDAAISTRSSHSAADVWTSPARTLTSFGTLIADIWTNSIRTLTEILVSTSNTNPANTLTARRGDYYTKSLTGLGSVTGNTKLWLDVKATEDGLQPDDDATIQIVTGSGFATTGLIYLNGETPSSNAWGSLTVDDAAAGDITIVLEADATVLLTPGRYYYGIKALVGGNPTTLVTGVFIVQPGYTAAVS